MLVSVSNCVVIVSCACNFLIDHLLADEHTSRRPFLYIDVVKVYDQVYQL